MLRRNYVTIDQGAILANYVLQKNILPENVEIMPVIKANAYGHGLVETAELLEKAGARHFAVATPDEGLELKKAGITSEILVLGAATKYALEESIRGGLSQSVFTPEILQLCNDTAKRLHTVACVHIKLDTGMNRIGLKTVAEAQALAKMLKQCDFVQAKGIYTHFSDADNPKEDLSLSDYTLKQLQTYDLLRSCFPADLPSHVGNSAFMLLKSDVSSFSMARQGISLYGYPPVPTSLPFRPALRWMTEVTCVKQIEAGEAVGYGCSFVAEHSMTVATVSVGYGDGYHRSASGKAEMLIRGKRAKVIGRICMDQTMVDATNIPDIQEGDEVVLIGKQGGDCISACELADWCGTIPYEVLLAISPRVPHIIIPFKE